MPAFRLFGRPPTPEPALEPGEGVAWAPGPWDGDAAPASRHARPVAFGHGSADAVGGRADDPPTDPHGFPPILPPPDWSLPAPSRAPDALEAAALAGAFAADYLSWDEDDPARRGQALAEHLARPVDDPALLGWDGHGRQRAEIVLPGPVRHDGDDRALVDVRVRVTPYRAVGDRATERAAEADRPEPDVPGVPAAAPAPTGRGWRSCASYWVRLSVPVVHADGRLAVDAADDADGVPSAPDDALAPVHALPAPEVPPPAAEPESAW